MIFPEKQHLKLIMPIILQQKGKKWSFFGSFHEDFFVFCLVLDWMKGRAGLAFSAIIMFHCSFWCPACQKSAKFGTSNYAPEVKSRLGRKIPITIIGMKIYFHFKISRLEWKKISFILIGP